MPSPTAQTPSGRSSLPASNSRQKAFGVYVHWPFCLAKCPYCDFNSHVKQGVDQARYADALVRELGHMAERMPDETVTSIFFGGGTPSLMEPATVARVLDEVARLWPLAPDAEITLEANPTSVEAERFRGYRAAGVNRVSLGVQALDDESLKRLGRMHTAEEALAAVALARDTFPRISFDLIYARPGQTEEAWRTELARALGFAADHLSLYQLTIEEGTPFEALYRAGKLQTPDEDTGATLFEITQDLCEAAGMPAYEVSNHAMPGAESRHNLVYWRGQPYAGVGPGAHGRLQTAAGWIATETRHDPAAWLAAAEAEGHGLTVEIPVDPRDRAVEMLLMGLRLTEGIDLESLSAPASGILDNEVVTDLVRQRFLTRNGAFLAATAKGRPVLNALLGELLA